MKFTPKDRLIVALDTEDRVAAQKLVDELGDLVSVYKVGIELFTSVGPEILDWLKEKGKKVFLDLKFHDIPRSVSQAVILSLEKEIFMVNLHLLGGEAMVRETVNKIREISQRKGITPPFIIGVTVLTSLEDKDLKRLGLNKDLKSLVIDLALMGKEAGLDGVVASAREAGAIKERLGREFLVVSPGIRPLDTSRGDQKRVMTPKEAVKAGADFLVVGRPVREASNPAQIVKNILLEIERT